MESTESGSVDDTIDSKNSETEAEDGVAKYDDPEALSSQTEEDPSGQQVYGYLYRSAGSEDATIYVDSRGFNLNGQSLIVTQNDEGNEIIVLVEDPNVQALDQTFAHLQPDDGDFEGGLKEHGTLVVDEHSQGLEFIKSSEEVPEERHMYIENSGEILNIANENVGSPVDIESSPLWSVTNSAHLKNDGTEMLFIPNPTVVLAPEETKHRKLMQLACIAHELQSADQKSSSTAICDYVKEAESSFNEYESSVNDIREDEENNLAADKCLSLNKTDECLNLISKTTKIDSLVLPSTSERAIDNTVSVIHSTSSELQNCSIESHTKPSSPPDFSSEIQNCSIESHTKPRSPPDFSSDSSIESHTKPSSPPEFSSDIRNCTIESHTKRSSPPDFSSENNFPSSESGLPAKMLYSNVAFSENLDESSNNKQLEECSSNALEEKEQPSSDEIGPAQMDSLELCNNDSPLIFVEKSHKLDVNNLNIEDDTDPCLKEVDEANSSVLVIDDENQSSPNSDSGLSLTECPFAKKLIGERTELEDKVPMEMGSDIDDDNVSSTEHSMSVSENESSFLNSRCSAFNGSDGTAKSSVEEDKVLQDHASQPDDMNESDELQIDESESNEMIETDLGGVPGNSHDSVLMIAEPVQENHIDSSVIDEAEPIRRNENLKSTSADDVNTIQEGFVDHSNKPNDVDRSVDSTKTTEPVHEVSSKSTDVANNELDVAHNKLDVTNNECYLNNGTEGLKVSKTYLIKKKIGKSLPKKETRDNLELFVSEDFPILNNNVEPHLNSPTDNYSSHENNTEPDDHLVSDLQSKVSVKRTYSIPRDKLLFRRKKLVPPKQVLRSTRLRNRSLSSAFRKIGNSEISEGHSQQSSFDTSNTDNIPWGKVLLETSFEPRNIPNDVPSTSFASQYPKETSTPLLSPEQRRRKLNKYKRDFDRLLNSSSPIATKLPKIGKKYSSRMHPNVIKATKSRYSSFHFSRLSKSSSSLPLSSTSGGHSRRKKLRLKGGEKPKEAQIQYLQPSDTHSDPLRPNSGDLYTCSSCNFSSIYVDNLMDHLKYCSNRQPVLDYEVNNMDKRQRIRGEEDITQTVTNTLKKIRNDLRSVLLDDDPGFNFPSPFREDERDSDGPHKRKKYGYGEDDVVWVEFEKRFWPALVCKINGLSACVKLISYPNEEKGLEVHHEKIRTFDNSKWNLLCLKKAERLPHHEIFVKAVQSCERFMSKKFLGVHVTGKEFFSVRDGVEFDASEMPKPEKRRKSPPIHVEEEEEDSDSGSEITVLEPARKARYEKLDAKQIFDHIVGGKADSYVLDIYHKRHHSKKHTVFFENDNSCLKHKPWFGPMGKTMQEDLFCHFRNLFINKIGKKGFFVSYICQVMIPEAIVHAISVVKDIPLKDAELLFESEDSLDLENEDPSIEEILKKYS